MSASDVEFRILGPLEVWVGGAAVAVGGPKLRALLALLLLDANRVVSRDRLVAELAGGDARGDAAGALKVQVSRVRALLADADVGGERVVSRPPGYLLRVEPGELDLHTFERLVDDARQARDNEDIRTAAARLREAESLWRGRALADLEFEPFARIEVERLEELRLTVLEERIDAELQLGRHAQLVPELDALVATHPLRERLRGQHMLALYRAGRQPDALEVYRAGRTLLVEELALEPGPRLKALEQAILRQEPSLDVDLPPGERRQATPSVVASEHEAGAIEGPIVAAARVKRRPRWRLAALPFVVVAGVAALIAGSRMTSGSTDTSVLADANQVALLSPEGAVKAAVSLPGAPSGVASGFGSLWVSESGAAQVVRVDPKGRTIVATIAVGRGPGAVVVGAGDVWVVNTLDETVSRIDPGADKVVQTIRVGAEPSDLIVAGGSVWVANHGDGTLTRIDPRTGRVIAVVPEGTAPRALAAAGSTLWLADDAAGSVARLDAATGRPLDVLRVGDSPSALVATAGGVWVLDPLDATLSRIDALRERVQSTVALSGAPGALVAAKGAVWVSDASGGTLTRLDPSGRVPATTIRVGGLPQGLSLDGGLWVATASGGASHKGGTLRVAYGAGGINTIDPAANGSPNAPPTHYLGLTNDGLVTLDHTDGPDGARLVPDLALSLPRPFDQGRSYTFRLRPGVRYSTGATVNLNDVRHSFERLFELRSSGSSFYSAIAGATACTRSPNRCDLSPGIVADERTDTVTFHLSRPDPDFLAKLTLPYADVLPASTPLQEAHSPLAATGPYEIASYQPGHMVLLVRNPHFHEWSQAAQPDGYPDRIVMLLRPTLADAARLVATAKADLMTNVGLPANERSYFLLHHPNQLRINPGMGTNFLFLNVHAPPFDDVRVRQALNLALDRSRIVAGFGGHVAATPTCQLLAPGMPGYKRYCPYTRHPTIDGRWRRPDLARARRLVAASGTTGMNVVVWDLGGGPPIEGVPPVDALQRLGYHASLRLLPASTYYTYTNDSRNHAQVIEAGWGADYPTANDFIGKLTCAYFTPGSASSTTNASELCDPAFDHRVAHAAALQTTDPPAANRLWARLDRELTNRAILLPTVTVNIADILSTRVGNYHYNPVWGVQVDQLWVR